MFFITPSQKCTLENINGIQECEERPFLSLVSEVGVLVQQIIALAGAGVLLGGQVGAVLVDQSIHCLGHQRHGRRDTAQASTNGMTTDVSTSGIARTVNLRSDRATNASDRYNQANSNSALGVPANVAREPGEHRRGRGEDTAAGDSQGNIARGDGRVLGDDQKDEPDAADQRGHEAVQATLAEAV